MRCLTIVYRICLLEGMLVALTVAHGRVVCLAPASRLKPASAGSQSLKALRGVAGVRESSCNNGTLSAGYPAMSSSPAPPRSARKASVTEVPASNGSWKQGGSPHSRVLSAPVEDLAQYGSRQSGLRFSASPVEVGGSLMRDVQLGTPTSAPAHPNCMDEAAAAVAGLSRQNSKELPGGGMGVPMPAPPKRVHSVATFKALQNLVEIEPIAQPGGAADFHGGSLDSAAESQRVQNAW